MHLCWIPFLWITKFTANMLSSLVNIIIYIANHQKLQNMSKIIEIHHHRDRALCLWRITMLQITKYITSTIIHWFGMHSLAFNTMFSSQCKIVMQVQNLWLVIVKIFIVFVTVITNSSTFNIHCQFWPTAWFFSTSIWNLGPSGLCSGRVVLQCVQNCLGDLNINLCICKCGVKSCVLCDTQCILWYMVYRLICGVLFTTRNKVFFCDPWCIVCLAAPHILYPHMLSWVARPVLWDTQCVL